MSLINHSTTWYYLDAAGNVVEGDEKAPSAAVSLLCAAGGRLDEGLAEQHGLADAFAAQEKGEHRNPVTGEPLVMRGDRAYAAKAFEPKNPDGTVARKAAPKAEAKAIHPADAGIENKMVTPGPASTKLAPIAPVDAPAPAPIKAVDSPAKK